MYKFTLIILFTFVALGQSRDSIIQLPPIILTDLGTLTIQQGTFNECADDTIHFIFLRDTIHAYSDTIFVQDTVCEPVIDTTGIRDTTIIGQWNVSEPSEINWSQVQPGDTILFHGTSTQRLDVRDKDNLTIINFKLRNYDGQQVHIQRCNNLVLDGFDISTPAEGTSQNDGIYAQYIRGITIKNSNIVINTLAGGHNDCIQFYHCADVLVEDNYLEHTDFKTSNAQGIYATTPDGGFYKYINNIIIGNTSFNHLTVRVLDGTKPTNIEIRGNYSKTNGWRHINLTELQGTPYNADILTSNVLEGTAVKATITQ